jgi:hypothetical protein
MRGELDDWLTTEPAYSSGLTMLAACGEKMMPARSDMTGIEKCVSTILEAQLRPGIRHTGLRQVELLLA